MNELTAKQRDAVLRIIGQRKDALSASLKKAREMGATLHIPLAKDELKTIIEAEAALSAPEPPDPSEPGGNSCPKCGGHSFQLQATFGGWMYITFTPEDDDFEVDDSQPGDSDWDGPANCRDCHWSGTLGDLVEAKKKTAKKGKGKK